MVTNILGGNKSTILNNWTLPFEKISATTILEVIIGPFSAAPLRLSSHQYGGGNKSIVLNNWTLPFYKISATTIPYHTPWFATMLLSSVPELQHFRTHKLMVTLICLRLVSNFKAIPAENPSCARIDERAKFGQHRKSVFVLYSQSKILTFACPGQLGIERDRINIFFKSPARANVFLQTRNVYIHGSRGTWLIWMCCIYLFNLPF